MQFPGTERTLSEARERSSGVRQSVRAMGLSIIFSTRPFESVTFLKIYTYSICVCTVDISSTLYEICTVLA